MVIVLGRRRWLKNELTSRSGAHSTKNARPFASFKSRVVKRRGATSPGRVGPLRPLQAHSPPASDRVPHKYKPYPQPPPPHRITAPPPEPKLGDGPAAD